MSLERSWVLVDWLLRRCAHMFNNAIHSNDVGCVVDVGKPHSNFVQGVIALKYETTSVTNSAL